MAGGNMGDLWISLDIRSKIDAQLKEYSGKIKSFQKDIQNCQEAINTMSADLNKMAKGSDAWNRQKEAIASIFRLVDDLINKTRIYENALDRVQNISAKFNKGGVVAPVVTNNRLDPRPIEQAIERYEKIQNILKRINELQGQRDTIRLDAQTGLGTSLAWETYQRRMQEVDAEINKLRADLKDLGASNMSMSGAKSQLDSLYNVLGQFEQGNRRAADSTRQEREEEQRRAKTLKDARVWFEQIAAAMAREEAQEQRNREGIAATSRARQQAIQSMRQQMQAQADLLQSQKTGLGRLYVQGRNAGMDSAELENILQRYREISRALLNLRTMMQNPSSLSFADMMNVGRYTGASSNFLREASQQVGNLRTRTHEAASAARDLASAFDRVHKSASSSSQVLSDIKSLFLQGGLVFGVQQIFNSVVKVGGEIEQQHIALQSILGDVSKANELFDQTKRLALESPFTFGELNRDVKQLAAFGVDTDNLYDTTKRLADVAAGLGVSFERLGLAYGQVKSRSWLDGKELRQFAYAGLPMLQKLAEYYNETRKDRTYSTRDVRDMITRREVSFEDVDAVIKRLTDEGGQFYNLQYVLSETLLGQFNKLKDAWDIMLGELASGNSLVGKFFKTGIQLATAFVQSVDKLGPVLAAAFSGFAAKKLVTAIGGTVGTGILSAKGSIAQDLRNRLLMGEQLNASEMRILRTKGMITARDMEILIKAGQISKQDLRRLYITGQINTALYKQSMAMTGLVTKTHGLSVYWRAFMMRLHSFNFATFGSALFGSIKSGIGSLAKGLWGLIGGLPGAMLTAGTMLVAKIYQSKQEMQDSINRINEEQNARYRDIDDFLSKNPVDKAKNGTEEDRIAAIENYKEKLKEVAPYNVAAFEMSMGEKESHEQRIDYLSHELRLVRAANDYNTRHSENLTKETKGDFEDTADKAKELEETYGIIEKRLGQLHISDIQSALPRMAQNANTRSLAQGLNQAIKNGETLEQLIARIKQEVFSVNGEKNYKKNGVESFVSGIFGNGMVDGYNLPNGVDKYIADYYDQTKAFKEQVSKLKEAIKEEIPNVGKDPAVTEAYKQFRESLEGQMQLSPDEKEMINISLDEAFGIENNDLQVKLADKLRDTIDQTIPEIAAKIRSGQELTQADKDKIGELMQVAVQELEVKYPMFSDKLQSLLDSSRFQATIHLAYAGEEWNDLQKRFYNNLPSILNDRRRYQLSNIANSWTKDNNMYSARNAAKNAIDQARNELKAEEDAFKKGKSTLTIVNKKRQDLQDMQDAALYGLGYNYEGELKKSNKLPKTDHSAERAREKAEREFMRARQKEESSIQAYYDTWDKWRKVEGDTAARNRVANDERFSAEFRDKYNDPEQLAKNYEKLANSIKQTTDERKQLVQELKAKAAEKEGQTELENAKKLNEIFKEQLDNLSKRYEWYQRLAKYTSKEVAGGIAFGSKQHSESYYQYLQGRVGSMDFTDGNGRKWSLPEVIALPDEDVLNKFGTNAQTLVKALKQERDKLDSSIVDTLEKGYEYFNNYGAQIDEINEKYDEQIARLKERNALDKDDKDYIDGKTLQQQVTVVNQQRGREIGSLNLKEFQDSDTWRKFFGTNLLLSTRQARSFADVIKGKLTTAFEQGGISADEYTQKIEEVNKTLEDTENNRSDMFTYLFDGGIEGVLNKRIQKYQQQYNSASKDYELWNRRYNEAEAAGNQGDMDFASKMKGQAKGVMEGADKMLQGAKGAASTVAIIDKIINGINDNVQKLKALVDDIASSIEVFSGKEHADNFRNSKGYAFVSGFSSASQGATDAWNSLKSGNIMGVVEGGYRSIVGWAEPWAKRHDAKLDKQIQLAERQNKLIDAMRSSIERRLTNALGGVYGYNSKSSDTKTIKDALDNYSLAKNGSEYGRNTKTQSGAIGSLAGSMLGLGVAGPFGAIMGGITGAILGGLFGHGKEKYKTNYTEDTFQSMQRADQTREYYDQMFASYKMQRDNLNAQMKAEEKKKDTDRDKVNDYKTQIDELDDKIKSFAKDMAKSLYDIDVKQWANELTEAIVSAWAAGEDAVDAYREKVKDLMRNLATNIVTQKIMEQALKPVEQYIESIMDAQSGKLNEDNIIDIANMLDKLANESVDDIVSLFERLKNKGWDLSDSNSSTMSSSIKGITETSADLLAAYLNAIRADVSVIRQLQGVYWPRIDITVTAQLQQLNMITQNTLRNAEAAERIEVSVNNISDMFAKAQNNTKPIYVYAK